MTPERWARLKDLFELALERPPAERSSILADFCSEDSALEPELRRLIEHSERMGAFLDGDAVADESRTFVAGQTVAGRFRIVGFLGRGGMGEVYAAEDSELRVTVALKTVRSESAPNRSSQERLRREIQLARQVTHPNVCRVFDFGAHSVPPREILFLTMELLSGETLAQKLARDGPLEKSGLLEMAIQIAQALSAAHRAGVVHGDLKPGNILLAAASDGSLRPVVMDFGLAHRTTTALDSVSGSIPLMGTPAYMAPELLSGGDVTVLSDIYALGVMLHEMVAGRRPGPAQEMAGNDGDRQIEANWQNVIGRCLKPSPQERFASVSEVIGAINEAPGPIESDRGDRFLAGRGLTDSGVGQRRRRFTRRTYLAGFLASAAVSIAAGYRMWNRSRFGSTPASLIVLPFRQTSGSSDGSLLAEGITDGLIESLRQRKLLRVIARGSAFHYRDRAVDAATLNRELNVTRILSGALETRNEGLRISAALLTAPNGEQIWSKQYIGQVNSILELQGEIARDVSAALKASTEGERRSPGQELSPTDLEAYKLYLKGRYQWNLRSEDGFRHAIDCFREAIGMDPSNERAFCGLADSYALLGFYGFAEPKDVMPEAKMAAQRALALNDRLAEAHASLGLIEAVYEWDWRQAGESFKKAIELDPSYVTAHHWYGFYLAWTGQPELALQQVLQAQVLDPLSLVIPTSLGWLAFWIRDYGRAETYWRHTVALSPNYTAAYAPLALARAQQSQFSDALRIIGTGRQMNATPNTLPDLARIYALAGQRANALRTIADAEQALKNRYGAGPTMAAAYEALRENDKAFEWLYTAYGEHASQVTFLKVDPRFDGLRSDPRFGDLLRKVRLA